MADPLPPDSPAFENGPATEQDKNFEALGRYIQGFEYMVSETRLGIIQIGIIQTTTNYQETAAYLDVILSHQAFSAQPLFDVFRATANMFTSKWVALDAADRKFVSDILADIHKRATAVIKYRNNIIHGTHHDAFSYPEIQEDFSRLFIWKRKVGQTGLTPGDVPRNRQELQKLTAECYDVRDLVGGIKGWMIQSIESSPPRKPTEFFTLNGRTWVSLVRYEREGDKRKPVDLRESRSI